MKALIVSHLKYPNGDAGSIRHHLFAKMLYGMGYQVFAVGLGDSTKFQTRDMDGVTYLSLRETDASKKGKIRSYLQFWPRFKKQLKAYAPDLILTDDLGPTQMMKLRFYCKRRKIRLVHDSVEWYSPEQFTCGKRSLTYIQKNIVNRYILNKDFHVIAISKYLYDYFTSKGIPTVRIPILVSQKDIHTEKLTVEDKVVFTYAGQAGKKDYLHIMLEAFSMLPQETLNKVEFRIVGCTREQVLTSGVPVEILNHLGNAVCFYGRITHDRVLEILQSTDFTILIRSETQRYAKAGFPTKFVESLANSTPVICNLTSDLDRYLKDGENGFVVYGEKKEELWKVLQTAVELPLTIRKQMYVGAEKTVKTYFDCLKYEESLKQVIQ